MHEPQTVSLISAEARAVIAEMHAALAIQHDAIDQLFALLILRSPEFLPTESGRPWKALLRGNAAINAAEEEFGLEPK